MPRRAAWPQGRDRTDAALKAFYKDVLPPNFAQARGASYLRLSQLAEQHNLEWSGRQGDRESEKDASLARMRIDDVAARRLRRHPAVHLSGRIGYRLHRHRQRRASQGTEPGAPLTLDLSLSTYYPWGPMERKRQRE